MHLRSPMHRAAASPFRRARGRLVAGTAALTAVLLALALLAPVAPAGAAGVTTHAWMAATAIDQVSSPQLKALLEANADEVRAGAHFPDSGYALSNKYGEEAHWQRYVDALVARIKTHHECTDLTAPHGPCAQLIAFTFGIAAHGMGDEVWDWLFEPNSASLDEYYTPADLGTYANKTGAETQMDLVAIGDYGQPTSHTVPFPDHADLLAAFDAAGLHGITDSQLVLGQAVMDVLHDVEAQWAPTHLAAVNEAMPWMAQHLVDAPGGVDFAATAIAGDWDSTWGQLLGDQPQTKVSITYPAPDERRVPATGWLADHEPGATPGNAGPRTRIAAALTYSRPYTAASGDATGVSSQLPAGSMTLSERDTGTVVPPASGYPKSVPYGADAGEHVVGFEPATELKACTWYQVSITTALVDAHQQPVAPYSWTFRTGTDAAGHRCPDDPTTVDEDVAAKVVHDVVGRSSTEADLDAIDDTLAVGGTRAAWVASTVASTEARTALVDQAFTSILGRSPDAAGTAYWVGRLATLPVTTFQAQLAGSSEAYRRLGGTSASYVTGLYPLLVGRPADAAGVRYWAGRLDAGMSRTALARQLTTSHEAARQTVAAAYQHFLGRAADASGLAHWTAVVERGADPRQLWRSLVLSAEYTRLAQAS